MLYKWANRDEKHGKKKGNVTTFEKNRRALQRGEQQDTCIHGIRCRLTRRDKQCAKGNYLGDRLTGHF